MSQTYIILNNKYPKLDIKDFQNPHLKSVYNSSNNNGPIPIQRQVLYRDFTILETGD